MNEFEKIARDLDMAALNEDAAIKEVHDQLDRDNRLAAQALFGIVEPAIRDCELQIRQVQRVAVSIWKDSRDNGVGLTTQPYFENGQERRDTLKFTIRGGSVAVKRNTVFGVSTSELDPATVNHQQVVNEVKMFFRLVLKRKA